ncbi:MAG: DUF2442 domain-containing protein [Bacteroidota bacterium]|nr:DUF2442 domain-containing protein [Bacteroidota bacterium]
MYLSVINVIPEKNYFLKLTFENGEIRMLDMKPYLNKGIFQELKKLNVFYSFRVSFDTIQWNNEADLDPEVLYLISEPIS